MEIVPVATASQVRAVEKLQHVIEDHTLTVDQIWAVLARSAPEDENTVGSLGSPGPWKILSGGRFRHAVFESPRCIVDAMADEDDDEDEGDARIVSLRRFVKWGKSTANGTPTPGWSPPPAEQVAAWVGAERLTVHYDGDVSRGRLVRSDTRLSVVFPIIVRVPRDLPPHRREFLDQLLDDAHHSWRMVRVGIRQTGDEQSAVAEVDITGAPLPIVEPLLRYATDALRHVVRWAAPSANLLASEKPCPLIDP